MQLDEKWSFVGKKEKRCDPDDEADWCRGDQWDHVALDPDHRLVLGVLVSRPLADTPVFLLGSARDRLGGRVPELVSSDEWPAYPAALLEVFGAGGYRRVPARRGGRPARGWRRRRGWRTSPSIRPGRRGVW